MEPYDIFLGAVIGGLLDQPLIIGYVLIGSLIRRFPYALGVAALMVVVDFALMVWESQSIFGGVWVPHYQWILPGKIIGVLAATSVVYGIANTIRRRRATREEPQQAGHADN